MTTFVLTTFLFFFPENRSLALLQVIYDARVDWWVYFFSPEAQKEFCWIAFDWPYSMSAAITYLNGPLNLDCVITVDARLCSYFWKNVERDCKCHLKGNLWQEGKCIAFLMWGDKYIRNAYLSVNQQSLFFSGFDQCVFLLSCPHFWEKNNDVVHQQKLWNKGCYPSQICPAEKIRLLF